MPSDLLDDLDERGLIHDTTDRDALAARLAEGPITLYYGCDPTAPSLHHGNLIGLIMLRRFQDAGHRPIALAGGATGMIGDPGGRSEERNLLDVETLAANVAAIKEQISRILGPEGRWTLVDNLSWTADVRLLDFLRDVGKHVTVNQMVARESVKARMASEHGISYTEFSYMLLQANDYAHLHEHEGCELQIGGSDQWGNILSGVDLIRRQTGHGGPRPVLAAAHRRRRHEDRQDHRCPGVARSRAHLAVRVLPALDQHRRRRGRADAAPMFTLLPDGRDRRARSRSTAPSPRRRVAQRALAREVTDLVHGADGPRRPPRRPARSCSGAIPARRPRPRWRRWPGRSRWPRSTGGEDLAAGVPLGPVLQRAGLASSQGDARRQLEQGGVS